MMQRVLSSDLWKTVTAQAKKAKQRQAAIAYVTEDHLNLNRVMFSSLMHRRKPYGAVEQMPSCLMSCSNAASFFTIAVTYMPR